MNWINYCRYTYTTKKHNKYFAKYGKEGIIMQIKSSDFEEKVIKSSKPVLVDFWATWCMPCQMQGPVIEQLEKETDSFYVGKVNVDEEPELQMKYGISSIPSLLIFKNGECVNTLVGFHTKEQLIEEMSKYTQ